MSADSTKAPTPARRRAARLDGQVARSDELTRLMTLATAAAVAAATAAVTLAQLATFTTWSIDAAFDNVPPTTALWAGVRLLFELSAPFALILLLAAAVSVLVQVGPLFTLRPIAPDLGRLFSRKPGWSRDAATALALDAARAAAVVCAVGWSTHGGIQRLLTLPRGTLPVALSHAAGIVLEQGAVLLGVLTAFAALDLVWRRWVFEQNLRMTDAELREEARRAEGSPELKAERRRRFGG